MPKVWSVAWREFKQTVFRPIFILAVVGMPLLFVGAVILSAVVIAQHEEPPLVGKVIIMDSTGEVAEAARVEFTDEEISHDQERQLEELKEQLTSGGIPSVPGPGMSNMPLKRGEVRIDIERRSQEPEYVDQAKGQLLTDEALAVAVIPDELLEVQELNPDGRRTFDLFVREGTDSDHIELIERRVGEAVVRVRATRAGVNPDTAMSLLRRPESDTRMYMPSGEETLASGDVRELQQMIPMVFMMLIWIGTFTAGQHLMMSTIEEKSNKVMEVLLSAVSPIQLMTGKIIGYGGVGLLIVSLYTLGLVGVAVTLIAMNPGTSLSQWAHPMDFVYLGVFFIMAFFMISSMLAAVGSAVSDIREANTLLTPVMLIVMLPLFFWMPIIQNPNGTIAVAFSFIPPAIPFAMILRIAAEEAVPIWQIPAAILWGYICMLGMVWFAAKVFRVGVLMTGKPPSVFELFKWVRYS